MFNKIRSKDNQLNDAYVCKSTDTKETDGIGNGDVLTEMDTNKNYMFDKDEGSWRKVNTGGGGGASEEDIERLENEIDTFEASITEQFEALSQSLADLGFEDILELGFSIVDGKLCQTYTN